MSQAEQKRVEAARNAMPAAVDTSAAGESAAPGISPEIRRGARLWFVKALSGLPVYGIYLFLLADTVRWPAAWLFLAMLLTASIAHAYLMLRTNPWLLAQRARGLREDGAPRWDKVVAGLGVGLLPLVGWTVAALDFRFAWSSPMPLWIRAGGVLLFAAAWVLVIWATYANRFFTTTVRIQPNHIVQTGGPYRFVRHPGYVGSIVYILTTPLVLGSWWATIPAIGGAAMMVLRTKLEDDFLHRELNGYAAFATHVRYRLVIGLW